MSTSAVIVGAGGHAVSVAETVLAAGHDLIAFTSDDAAGGTLLGRPVLGAVPADHLANGGIVVLAIGANGIRERVWNRLTAGLPAATLTNAFPPVVHPSASVSSLATLGPGTVVLQRAVVCSGATVGTACILNTGSILDHESDLGDFASLAPAAVTGGRVRIGRRSALSIGAVVRHGLSIGADTVIGSASYAHSDIPDSVVAYGSPARVVRSRLADDPYL